MIKECKVISYNKFLNILVFDYNGKQIQTTHVLDNECKTVFVKYQNNKYEIVSKSDYEKYINEDKNKDTSVRTRKKEKEIKPEDVSE